MSRFVLPKPLIERIEPIGAAIFGSACAALVVYKLVVALRLNIGPDEFWTLHLVHAAARQELPFSLAGAHVHVFNWLTQFAALETTQVVIGRLAMVILLGGTAAMIWSLGRRWFGRLAAAVPPLLYLSSIPVVVHGGAFRPTSILAFLLMAVMLSVGRGGWAVRRAWLSGGLFGLATAVTFESLLFVPMILACITALAIDAPLGSRVRVVFAQWAGFLIGAALSWAGVTTLHWLISSSDPASIEWLEAPGLRLAWPARGAVIGYYATWQPLAWGLMTLGLVIALAHRRHVVAATALSALPGLIYTGAYTHFLVVTMAPLSLLAGMSIQWFQDLTEPAGYQRWRPLLTATMLFGLLFPFAGYLERPLLDRQRIQRDIVAGVHQIFPQPVSYLDRCGMVATFEKANGLVTRSSVARYRDGGEPTFRSLIRERRPAFVLMNAPLFSPGKPSSNGLLEEDRRAIDKLYPRYWGPIRVAGGRANVVAGESATVEVPFPARYRLESTDAMVVQGVIRQPNDVFTVTDHATIALPGGMESIEPHDVRLVLASAGPRPTRELDPQPIFVGL
jgi:hypothetical protein